MQTVAIAGVGLIGGSFGLALRKAGFSGRILGVSSTGTLYHAIKIGAVDEGATLEEAAREADLIYLAQPIHVILNSFPRIGPLLRTGALVTDAGSTKAAVVRSAAAHIGPGRFLGGHPLAGKESSGIENADPDLFRGRLYVLTPTTDTELETPQSREFRRWLNRIGVLTVVLSPEEHDRVLALTSHLPQLAATALAKLLAGQDMQCAKVFGPALLDSTRLALSPFNVWADILSTNRCEIERGLSLYIETLQELRDQLRSDQMRDSFAEAAQFARKIRASAASDRSGRNISSE